MISSETISSEAISSETIPKMIFLVPYRNRENELNHFKYFMRYILEDITKNEYEIFYVYQNDSKPFNRGAIKNIGFIAIKNKYPNHYKDITLIFNDIDITPSRKNLFDYNTKRGIIKHFYGFKQTLGGIVSITGDDFENINGFPNFWGWGFEDNCLQDRAIAKKININRDNFYNYTDNIIINIDNKKTRLQTKEQIWRYNNKYTAGIKEIKNLKYHFENDMIIVMNFDTESDYRNQTYYNDYNRRKPIADVNFKPHNALNTEEQLKKNGIHITDSTKKLNNRGIGMKLL